MKSAIETKSAKREKAAKKAAPAKKAAAKKKAAQTGNKAARKADSPRKGRKAATPKKGAKKGRKAATPKKGGGRALNDFANSDIVKVLKPKAITRKGVFKTGQTVADNIKAQGKAGFSGRRKFLRAQIAAGRVSLRSK